MNETTPSNAGPQVMTFDIFDRPAEQIDWPRAERFADAAVASPDELIDRLMSHFDQLDAAANEAMEPGKFVEMPAGLVLIPSVLGLAGPELASSWQERIARWLAGHLEAALDIDDDLILEIMTFTGERLGEGGLAVAAERLLAINPDDPELWRTPWFSLWSIAEDCVRLAGQTEPRRQLDEFAKGRLDQIIRERLDPEDLDQPLWYLIRSDPVFMKTQMGQFMVQCRQTWPGKGARRNPALRELKAAAEYLQGDQEQVDLYDRPTDFRKAMQCQLDWLNQEPPAEQDTTFLDRAGFWDDDASPSEDLPPFEIPVPIVRDEPRIGRNDPCPCGSGKKYKKCCMNG